MDKDVEFCLNYLSELGRLSRSIEAFKSLDSFSSPPARVIAHRIVCELHEAVGEFSFYKRRKGTDIYDYVKKK